MERIQFFNQYRDYLFAIAYRMLGSAMDAEDMVQDTYLRWQQIEQGLVENPKSYLASIITRLCIDHLRSARVQREQYVGPWLPEPLLTGQAYTAPDTVALDESLSMAFLVMLESLSPTERAVFLLREVFGYAYAEIAQIVQKSEANCRQMVRRARQHIQRGRPRFDVSLEEQQAFTNQFLQACMTGDVDTLVDFLAEEVTIWSDGGGKAVAATKPIYGLEKAIRFLTGLARNAPPNTATRFASVNQSPGLIIYVDGQPIAVMTFEVDRATDDQPRIIAIRSILNPDKLSRIPSLEG